MTKENAVILRGIITSEHEDMQKEIVKTEGIEYDFFVNKGYLSWNFSTKIEDILGVPMEVRKTMVDNIPCLYLKARLFLAQTPETKERLNNITSLINQGRVGWGIEGSVTTKKGNIIEECVLRSVSLTAAPANPHTYVEVFNEESRQFRKGK